MSLGLVYSNGLEAIVVTDRRILEEGAIKKDDVKKHTIVASDNYEGVVMWAGDRGIAQAALNIAEDEGITREEKYVQDYLHHLNNIVTKLLSEDEEEFMRKARERIQYHAKTIPEKDRDRHIKENNMFAQDETMRNRQAKTPVYCFVGYEDKRGNKKLKIRILAEEDYQRVHQNQAAIGDRRILGHVFVTDLGLEDQELAQSNLGQLTLYGIRRYIEATSYISIGGTPDIVTIGPNSINDIDYAENSLISNLVGAYIAEMIPGQTSTDVSKRIMAVIDGDMDIVNRTAESLHDTVENLSSGRISQRNWRKRARKYNS